VKLQLILFDSAFGKELRAKIAFYIAPERRATENDARRGAADRSTTDATICVLPPQ
jgi:hypothetical protein